MSFSGALNFATVPRLVSAVRERHPHVELLLVARLATAESVTRLVHGEVDLAFVGLPVEPLDVLLAAGHPLAGRRRVRLTAVAEEPFVTMPTYPGSALSEVTFQAFAQHGIRPHIAQEVNDPYLLLSMVAEGIGAAIVPTGMRPILPAGVVAVELSGTDLRLVSGLAWNRAPVGPALGAVLQVAETVLPTPPSQRGRIMT